tara:strand:- start:755 stop:1519 length:765 start_codon:yes stop_codon:yes gene_type:complete
MASSLHQIPTTQECSDFNRVVFVDVSKYFGRRRALAHVSLECGTGEILGFLGGNGAGKSTLLALAGTILAPSSGEIRYGAESVREAGPALRANIGLLSHDFQLYPELTARENLEFFSALYGLDQVRDRSHEALRSAGLLSRGDDFVGGFSRGMKQRVALERTLLHAPRLVLLDEPFAGLDEGSSSELVERLQTLKSEGRIIFLATHDFEVAELVLDRAMLLRAGRLIPLSRAGESLRARYRDSMQRELKPRRLE